MQIGPKLSFFQLLIATSYLSMRLLQCIVFFEGIMIVPSVFQKCTALGKNHVATWLYCMNPIHVTSVGRLKRKNLFGI